MASLLHVLAAVALMLGGCGALIIIGWILTRLRGRDGPLTPMDLHTASDHLRSRHF